MMNAEEKEASLWLKENELQLKDDRRSDEKVAKVGHGQAIVEYLIGHDILCTIIKANGTFSKDKFVRSVIKNKFVRLVMDNITDETDKKLFDYLLEQLDPEYVYNETKRQVKTDTRKTVRTDVTLARNQREELRRAKIIGEIVVSKLRSFRSSAQFNFQSEGFLIRHICSEINDFDNAADYCEYSFIYQDDEYDW